MDGFEARARARGYRTVAGVDEAGRGPLAGPVVAAAVVLPPGFSDPAVRDLKALSPAARDRAFSLIVGEALAYSVAHATPEEIDRINILQASLLAMRRAVEGLSRRPDFVFVDGNIPIPPPASCPVASAPGKARRPRKAGGAARARASRAGGAGERAQRLPFAAPPGPPGCVFAADAACLNAGRPVPGAPTVWCAIGQEAVISGDSTCRSIMAASVLAKVTRDRAMEEFDRLYPGYGFASHKGYATGEHVAAIRRLGPCPIHRMTFHGVRDD
ncbi:MAG: ribonuclease HII [Gemmatimonadota bacterium]